MVIIGRRKVSRRYATREWVCVLCLLLQGFIFLVLHNKLQRITVYPDLWLEFTRFGDSEPPFSFEDDKKAAYKYLHRIKSFDRPLKFFHIPKTAGTAIEHVAGKQQVAWGSCLFNHKPKRDICRHLYSGAEWPGHVGWWHLPSHVFPIAHVDPYHNSELFAVIRDPYDRMVSEFYYICTLKVMEWRPDQCDNRTHLTDANYMNSWLQQKLAASTHHERTPQYYMADNGHFTPQYDYLVDPQQVRRIDHVLHLGPELPHSFERLMQAFGLEQIRLMHMNAISAQDRNATTDLDVQDLDEETRKSIQLRYSHDFNELAHS